ncbi:MAG: DUF4238 domain-containing protein [Gemmataceae bacterium]|nr:DUF4238 domain-containing protein [Gemmataceae bacterium]
MAEKRYHHFLPRFYLRGFTDPHTPADHEPFVWVRDVTTGKISKRAPKNLAAETGYYAVETPSGLDYATVENELAQMEGKAAGALRSYLAMLPGTRGAIPADLSVLLAWLGARVPWLRRVADEQWAAFLESAANGGAELPPDSGCIVSLVNERTQEQRQEPIESALPLIRSGQWFARLGRNQVVEVMKLQAWYFRNKLMPNLAWILLTAPSGHCFVTSDRPVVWFIPAEGFADSPAALKHPRVELTVPLDAKHAVLALGSRARKPSEVHVDEINRRTVDYAERFVVAPARDLIESPQNAS